LKANVIFCFSLDRNELEGTIQFPSRIQSRILAVIHSSLEENVTTEMILKETGIAQSTWSEEQNRLIENGLLEKKQTKIMSPGSKAITRIMRYSLTTKGKLIAHNLANISRIMAPEKFLTQFSAKSEKSRPEGADEEKILLAPDSHSLDDTILECIEVGLESFGMNLDKLVKEGVQSSGLEWKEVSKNPDKLVYHMVQLFGKGGALTIEQLISANIKSRLQLHSISSNNLSSIISELRSIAQNKNRNLLQ
jgi:hypothetical protein